MLPIRLRAAFSAALAAVAFQAGFAGPIARAQEPARKKAARPATPAPPAASGDKLKVPKGFKAELIYSVPRETQGSWVNLTVDPKGRLITSDQYGKLYRVTPPKLGAPASEIQVEPIAVEIGEAQGLLWAFDSLYVVVNSGGKYPSGLYRVSDTDGDDALDKVEVLRKLEGSSEHGPHAVVLAPDGKSLYVVAGNATRLPDLKGSDVPRTWGEDNLLPRLVDGRGFMTDEKAPGGYICRVSPDGKDWDLQSMGYRNAYDMAFNRAGDLFTYDSDMEWDQNTPWYRPTRVCLAAPGSDFGYRNGAGKWPTYSIDGTPPVVNIGPGSPTGVTFGYGAKFPAKYQDAFFISDWSYGKLYAVHLKPEGASYGADVEEFITGAPLPLTDLIVNPADGALYFAIGGRRTTSGLYRVTYAGDESTAPSTAAIPGEEARAKRRALEAFQGHADPNALAAAWPCLADPDRSIRAAARVALEFQPPETWAEKALAEANPLAALEALLALAHVSAADPAHRTATSPTPDPALGGKIFAALSRIDYDALSYTRKLDLVRVTQVVLHRFGKPETSRDALLSAFDARFPTKGRELNVEILNVLVFLGSTTVAAKAVPMMDAAPSQEEQIDYARALRALKVGWTPELRRAYFSWFGRAATFKGGNSFGGFVEQIKRDALANLGESERAEVRPILDAKPDIKSAAASVQPRAFVKSWTLDELVPVVEAGLKQKRDFDRGRSLFAAAQCYSCHRYDNEGGAAGPDLTAVSGRFGARDLVESIVLPSKTVSDQYEAIVVATTDGQVITGRVVNLNGDGMMINTNMLDPNAQVTVDRAKIEEVHRSPVSMMPEGLLSTLDKDEIADLVAYLFSRGNREAKMFQ